MKYATNRLIDSVWTLGYEVIGEEIKIISYDRDNEIGYMQESTLPIANKIIENEDRIVQSVVINGEEFNVVNKGHVFSYS